MSAHNNKGLRSAGLMVIGGVSHYYGGTNYRGVNLSLTEK